MAEQNEAKVFTATNRPEEVAYIHGQDVNETVREHGRLLVEETERTLQDLASAIVGGQIDMESPAMRDAVMQKLRDLQGLLEKSTLSKKQIDRGEELQPELEKPDAMSLFVQFTEDLKRRVTAKGEELRLQEQRYQSGDITEEQYRHVENERVQYNESIEDEMRKHGSGLDVSDPTFKSAVRFVNEHLGTGLNITPRERLDSLWTRQERSLLPFARAYEQDLEAFRAGKLSEAEIRDAWQEKVNMFERFSKKISAKRGLLPEEVFDLEQRARDVLRPDEPIPLKSLDLEDESKLPELEPLLDPEDYDARVRVILKHVDDLVTVADALEREGKLDAQARGELLGQLRMLQAQQVELDEKAENPQASRELHAVVDMMAKLRERLSNEFYIKEQQPEQPPERVTIKPIEGDEHGFEVTRTPVTKAASVEAARDMYRRVKATYASVQHTLSVDARREMRTHIATLSGLVRSAESQALQGEDARRAVAHATEHAPLVAHAALASVRQAWPQRFEVKTIPTSAPIPAASNRSIWGALGGAFKLK